MEQNLQNIRVMVKSLSSGMVTYSSDTRHVRREWTRQGQIIPIPADELQEVIYDNGIYNLFAFGYLGIDNPDHRVLVGLEYEGSPVKMVPFDTTKAQKLLSAETSIEEFKKAIANFRSGHIETLVNAAYQMRHIDLNKQRVLAEKFGIDVVNLIRNNEETQA